MKWIDKFENKKQTHYFSAARYDIDDEFYTSYNEIQKELKDYKKYFQNKIVICPCNDAEWSNFYKYFHLNFNELGLKKLITTSFNIKDQSQKSIKTEITKKGITRQELKGNGDFRSDEVIELIKEADIVVTNPPFSLFRDLIEIVVQHEKEFLIVGGTYSITYKKIFEYYKQGKIWLGNNQLSLFTIPNGSKKRFSNISWFTNLKTITYQTKIPLTKRYQEHLYPQYDNYKIIEVAKVNDIPIDYTEEMGVPLTIFLKHNPAQFEILCCDFELKKKYPKLVKQEYAQKNTKSVMLNGEELFTRIIIKRKSGLIPQTAVINQL